MQKSLKTRAGRTLHIPTKEEDARINVGIAADEGRLSLQCSGGTVERIGVGRRKRHESRALGPAGDFGIVDAAAGEAADRAAFTRRVAELEGDLRGAQFLRAGGGVIASARLTEPAAGHRQAGAGRVARAQRGGVEVAFLAGRHALLRAKLDPVQRTQGDVLQCAEHVHRRHAAADIVGVDRLEVDRAVGGARHSGRAPGHGQLEGGWIGEDHADVVVDGAVQSPGFGDFVVFTRIDGRGLAPREILQNLVGRDLERVSLARLLCVLGKELDAILDLLGGRRKFVACSAGLVERDVALGRLPLHR